MRWRSHKQIDLGIFSNQAQNPNSSINKERNSRLSLASFRLPLGKDVIITARRTVSLQIRTAVFLEQCTVLKQRQSMAAVWNAQRREPGVDHSMSRHVSVIMLPFTCSITGKTTGQKQISVYVLHAEVPRE